MYLEEEEDINAKSRIKDARAKEEEAELKAKVA
jgi:hypothetical protein